MYRDIAARERGVNGQRTAGRDGRQEAQLPQRQRTSAAITQFKVIQGQNQFR